jgi:hypothetical protein
LNKNQTFVMKIAYLLLLIGLRFSACNAQPESWSKTSNWKVYAAGSSSVFTFPVDSLKYARNNTLNADSVRFYLRNMTPLSKDREPTWMGAWLGSYEGSDGTLHKVEIGTYGGYFLDVSSGRYFSLPRALIRPWQKFIASSIPE